MAPVSSAIRSFYVRARHLGVLDGAAVGAAPGAVSDDAGAWAMYGVGIGRVVHAIRARRQIVEQQQAQAQDHQERQAQLQSMTAPTARA